MVNVLIVGSGGREHSIGWKLGQSENVDRVFHAPGNGGTLNNVQISIDDLAGLAKFASENNCFTIVGPEAPLAMGIVDMFNEKGLKIFGPTTVKQLFSDANLANSPKLSTDICTLFNIPPFPGA